MAHNEGKTKKEAREQNSADEGSSSVDAIDSINELILDLLLCSVQKAISYLQEVIQRLIENCMKSHR